MSKDYFGEENTWWEEFKYNVWYPTVRVFEYVWDTPKRVKWFFQRGWRGYADYDCWSFDNYLAKVIAGGLRDIAKHAHGYPAFSFCRKSDANYEEGFCKRCEDARGECYAFKRWIRLLNGLASRFEKYDALDDKGVWSRIYDSKKKAFVPVIRDGVEIGSSMEYDPPFTDEENELIRKDFERTEQKIKGALRTFSKYFGSFWD
jgi:hypothetical protein